MDRRWVDALLAVGVGIAGFGLGLGLDEIEGSHAWPGGPEIVLVIAVVATVSAALGLALALDRRTWASGGLVVLLAGAGFAGAWGGFVALVEVEEHCGPTPFRFAETSRDGPWENETARQGLQAQGLEVRYTKPHHVRGWTRENGTSFAVSVKGPEGPGLPSTASSPFLSASFSPEAEFASNEAAREWTEANREELQNRFESFLAGFEEETGWRQQGNTTWDERTATC